MFEKYKEPKYIAIGIFIALFVIGALFSFLFGRSSNNTNRASSSVSSSVAYVTKTVNPNAPIIPANPSGIVTTENTVEQGPVATEGDSKIPVWKAGEKAPSFNVANGVKTSLSPLATNVFNLWYPNFTQFVNNFGKTFTNEERDSWKSRISPYVTEGEKAYINSVDVFSIPQGTPQSFYVLRADENWITLRMKYDTGSMLITMIQDTSNPNKQWLVQNYSILIDGGK